MLSIEAHRARSLAIAGSPRLAEMLIPLSQACETGLQDCDLWSRVSSAVYNENQNLWMASGKDFDAAANFAAAIKAGEVVLAYLRDGVIGEAA